MTAIDSSSSASGHYTPAGGWDEYRRREDERLGRKRCPTCDRQIPKPPPANPSTRVVGFRVPVGEYDRFEELVDNAAERIKLEGGAWPNKGQTIMRALERFLANGAPRS